MNELHAAWDELFDVLPVDWTVARPVEQSEHLWIAYARDTRYQEDKATPPFWEAAGVSEVAAVRELARCLRELSAGRVPK